MGDARFIVRENSGYAIHPGATQAGNAKLRTEVMVLDRAYCHRVIWSSWEKQHGRSVEWCRAEAEAIAGRLNAGG